MVRIIVFGYNREGNPEPGADLVLDVRRLDNPHRHPQYRSLTGKHPEIQEYVRRSHGFAEFWADALRLVETLGPDSTIAIGCAFGKHRSRAVAHLLRERLIGQGVEVEPIAPYVFKNGNTDEWAAWA